MAAGGALHALLDNLLRRAFEESNDCEDLDTNDYKEPRRGRGVLGARGQARSRLVTHVTRFMTLIAILIEKIYVAWGYERYGVPVGLAGFVSSPLGKTTEQQQQQRWHPAGR